MNSRLNNTPLKPCKGRLIWRYNYAHWPAAWNLIQHFNWETIFSDDIDQVWGTWLHTFMSIMREAVPSTVLKTRRNLPWLNKPIVQLIRKRNMLFKQAKQSGDFSKYKKARNRAVSNLHAAKRRYFKELCPREPKRFWKAVKFLNKREKSIPTLKQGTEVATTNVDKANMLNLFFKSCFNTVFPPLSPTTQQHQPPPPEIYSALLKRSPIFSQRLILLKPVVQMEYPPEC